MGAWGRAQKNATGCRLSHNCKVIAPRVHCTWLTCWHLLISLWVQKGFASACDDCDPCEAGTH
eukprot:826919-Amphidinium_carterae.2